MIRRLVGKIVAMVALAAWLMTAATADAAAGGSALSGVVVHAKTGRGVANAHVKVAKKHHHKKKHKKHKKGKKAGAKVRHAAHAGHHAAHTAAVVSSAGGKFTIRTAGSGMVSLVAHKRGVGSGRATVAAGSGKFAIVLHKKHHAHSGVITKHVRHAVKKRAGHKKGRKNKVTTSLNSVN